MKVSAVLILCFLLNGTKLMAQQCGYNDYYLFVVHVHTANSKENVPDLSMCLVDELEKPILVSETYREGKQWKKRNVPLCFWENKHAKKKAGTKPLLHQKFYNLGDYYVVAFHMYMAQLKDPLKYPIYQLKIEEDNGGISQRQQIIHLPVQKAVRICNNSITENFTLSKPVQTLDGKNFVPIEVILDQNRQMGVEEKPESKLKYVVRFSYRELPTVNEGTLEYLVNEARVYNVKTGKLHQEIYIPSMVKSFQKESKNVVAFMDFYNRGIPEAMDFSVMMDSWRDLENKVSRQKTNFYLFDTTSKKYGLDTMLSNYNDVFYYAPLRKMRRYEYVSNAKSRIVFTYQLEDRRWVLLDKNETLIQPVPPKTVYAAKNCILFQEKAHTLPLKAVIGTNAKIVVKDTFWLYNACDDTVFISKVQSANRDFFSINQTILPKQRTPLIFHGTLISNSFDFHIWNYTCNLTLNDGSILNFGISVPLVSNNAFVYYRPDSSVHYAIANKNNARFCHSVFTYTSGRIRAEGYLQDKDTGLKAGKWKYFKNGSPGIEEVVYSKSVSLSAFDETYSYQHNAFKVKVLVKGVWKQPVTEILDRTVHFYITPETDSIVAFTDSTRYGFVLPYEKVSAELIKEFYLLKPNERTLRIGYYEMPFSPLEDQYTIILNYDYFKSGRKTTYQLVDSVISELIKQYPKIAMVWVSRSQRGFSLQGLSPLEKSKVLQQLAGDKTIQFVCRLFTLCTGPSAGFCDNRVYAKISTEKLEEFKKAALSMGFTDIRPDMDGRYWFTWKNKMIDEDFFDAFKKLTEHPSVISAYFNTYREAELDQDVKH